MAAAQSTLAISYLRWSTDPQTFGDSERRQVEATKAFCARHELSLDESRALRDPGVSAFRGKNARRGDLAGFLDAVKSGRVPKGATLVIESLDRLSRDELEEAGDMIRGILKHGVRIGNIRRDKILDRSSLDSLLDVMETTMWLAHEESAKKSMRNKADWVNKRAKMGRGIVVTKRCPWWLAVKEDRSGFTQVDDKVALVRSMFADANQGKGCPAITKALNLANIPSPTGKLWTFAVVGALLRDRRVLGEIALADGSTLPTYYPQIIDPGLFDQVGLAMRQRTTRTGKAVGRDSGKINIVRGLLWDAMTGSPMGLNRFNKPGDKAYKLVVSRLANGSLGQRRAFVYDYFEQAFLTFVSELKPSDFSGNGSTVDKVAELMRQAYPAQSEDRQSGGADQAGVRCVPGHPA